MKTYGKSDRTERQNKRTTLRTTRTRNQLILSISFLQQSTPELIPDVGMAVDQLPVLCWQQIINHHLCPRSKAPEAETENPSVFPWVFGVPFLLLKVWNHLRNHGRRSSSVSALCCLFPGQAALEHVKEGEDLNPPKIHPKGDNPWLTGRGTTKVSLVYGLYLFPAPHRAITHLLPEAFPQSQAGAGSHKPAVPQLALVEVVGAHSIHEQVGIFTEVLKKQTRDCWRLHPRNDHSILPVKKSSRN